MSGIDLSQLEHGGLIKYVENHLDSLLFKWLRLFPIEPQDEFYPILYKNGETALNLFQVYFYKPEDQKKLLLKKGVQEIVDSRLITDISLQQLVENINVGRKVLMEELPEVTQNFKQINHFALLINSFFNAFIDETISYYTHIKDEIIQEKSQFIQEMHHDRLTIVGKIAASFAHEFRNPLTSIKGFLYLLERDISESEVAKGYYSIIHREIDSLEKKISQFLYLSKRKGLDDSMEPFNLTPLIKEMIQFMYPRFLGDNIHVFNHIGHNLYVYGVREQFKQVLLNILNNAVEELGENEKDRYIEVDAWENGQEVCIEISNNGRMIPKHILDNIFEPFISTKELGTGIGLSVCRQIIEKHDGTIEVVSTKGRTSFKMVLQRWFNK